MSIFLLIFVFKYTFFLFKYGVFINKGLPNITV